MKFAVLALTLFLAVAAQAAAMPGDEPSDIQMRFTTFKAMMHQLKDIMDRAIANSPDSQQLHTPAMISQGLGHFCTMLSNNEDAIVASLSAGHEIISQMTGAGELSGEMQTAVSNLDAVFKSHLAEYNLLLKPILTEFKQSSMRFSEAVAPKVEVLRTEFRSNLDETVTALGPVMRTLFKMASNFRESVSMYVDDYRRSMEEMYTAMENMTPEEKERKKAEIEAIGQEIVTKFQKLYEVASGAAPAS